MAIALSLCYNSGAMTDWLSLLKADPLLSLLAAPEPAVRWWTLRDLLDRPSGDPEVTVARLAARQSAPDGSWRQAGELAFRGGMLYDFGHAGQASPWVTLRAARAIKRACGGG